MQISGTKRLTNHTPIIIHPSAITTIIKQISFRFSQQQQGAAFCALSQGIITMKPFCIDTIVTVAARILCVQLIELKAGSTTFMNTAATRVSRMLSNFSHYVFIKKYLINITIDMSIRSICEGIGIEITARLLCKE